MIPPKKIFSQNIEVMLNSNAWTRTAHLLGLDDSKVLSGDFPGLKTSAVSMTSVVSTASMASMTSTASFHQKIY